MSKASTMSVARSDTATGAIIGDMDTNKQTVASAYPLLSKIKSPADVKALPEQDIRQYGLIEASLETIFSKCDIISLHTPLFDATYHLIGEPLLKRIKEGALLVNTSRGAVVDQRALEKELASGRFTAVLDVYEKEPPEENCLLFELPNVMMLPHQAGPTVDMRTLITRELLLEGARYIDEGRPLVHEITREMAKTMSEK